MREPARSFEDLIVWQKSHAMVLDIYRLTNGFPKHEQYGLTLQMRRAAVSVPANIAEGFRRRGRPDKARVMNIAQGSLEETRYYVRLSRDLGYHTHLTLADAVDEVGRLLDAYARAVLRSASSVS
jgi:four helix bundle protein